MNCGISGLDCHVITTEYRTLVHCIHMYHLFCNALTHVIYSGVSGQCSYTIPLDQTTNDTQANTFADVRDPLTNLNTPRHTIRINLYVDGT